MMSAVSGKPLLCNSSSPTSSGVTSQSGNVPKSDGSSSQCVFGSVQTQITYLNDKSTAPLSAENNSDTPTGLSTSSFSGGMSDSAVFTTASESQPSPELKATVKSSTKKNQVKIILHGKANKEIVLEQKDYTRTVEDVCVRLLKDHYQGLGPAAVQLFGLASLDSKRSPKIIWKNPCSTFLDVMKSQENQNYEYYLRLRFVPYYEKPLERLQNFGSDLVKYLFYQCSDDYVKDRLKKIFNKQIDSGAKKRGYAVLHMLIDIKEEGKDGPDYIRKYKKIEDFLPSVEIPKHFWNLFKKLKLQGNINDQLDLHWESYCKLPVEELMLAYIRDVVQTVEIYGIEQYQAQKVDVGKEVSLVINVHTEDANMKGLYLDEELFSRIEDFRSISIISAVQSTGVNVHLDRSEGHSQVLGFTSMEVAESFVSGLNGYYRLLSDYYMSLCQQVEPPSQKSLIELRCHGPVETDYAVEKLKQRYSDEQYYILKQHVTAFHSYDIIFSNQQQYRRWTIHKEKGKFMIEKDEEKFNSLKNLIIHMVEVRMALPKNPRCVRPRQEPCHNLRRLFFKEDALIPDEDMEDKMMASRILKQPVVFLTTDIQLEPAIDLGSFTEVRRGYLHDGRKVAVKTLRKTRPEQMFMCYEHIHKCAEKMIQIEEPKFFVGVCGIRLSTPLAIVMENAQFGSLQRFFQQRKPDQPIQLYHLLTASIQIASGLLYLQEHNMYHGGICCHNILLFKYALDAIHVKIGDPGMVTLLNTQPIDYEENRRRIPWLAPELLDDLSQMTTQTDMYAFGTTMWEMYSFGKNPVDTLFMQFSSVMISQRMEQHKLPTPECLVIKKNEDIVSENEEYIPKCKQKVLKAMRLCWETQPQCRPGANEMVRDLNSIMATYGASYHLYSTIPEYDLSANSTSTTSNLSNVPSIPVSYSDMDSNSASVIGVPPSNHAPMVRHQNVQNERVPAIVTPSVIPPSPARQQQAAPSRPPATVPPQCSVKGRPPMDPLLDLNYLIPSSRLLIHSQVLGKGHYGEVKKGSLYKSSTDRSHPEPIAAKILKGEFQNVLDSPEFRKEAKLMAALTHPNIVKFIGISDNKLILEYVENKALSSFLRKQKETKVLWDVPRLVRISLEVAEGMKYLSSQKIIHCDLAGRNVLVTKDYRAKISDFGLAKELAKDKDYYTRSQSKDLPLLWCAPEAISYRKFTIKSDIWSYGILMWEIFTYGKAPRLGQNVNQSKQIELLNKGERLAKPSVCPEDVYSFMRLCWEQDILDRPDFVKASDELSQFHKKYPVKEKVSTDDGNKKSKRKTTDEYSQVGISTNIQKTAPPIKEPEAKPAPALPPARPKPKPTEVVGFLIPTQKLQQFEDQKLGQGEFGYVIKGKFRKIDNQWADVAIKKLKHNEEIKDAFEEEVNNIGIAEHENIVKFYGYMRQPDFVIVMEYVENGSLKAYLDKAREKQSPIEHPRLLSICIDVAKGMDYLSSINVVHSDLAARNILLTDTYTAKITDFGLSKTLMANKDYYRRQRNCKIPAYYVAPEYFSEHKLSVKGDVWGYGVMMWECFSMGLIPNMFDTEKELGTIAYHTLQKGERLLKPNDCPESVYELMHKCWKWEPEYRPTFAQIHARCLTLQEEIGHDRPIQQDIGHDDSE